MTTEFTPFPKIGRLNRETVITEKIDGTNASVFIREAVEELGYTPPILAASRKRWITPEDDNFGFARWVQEHEEELLMLGPGHHFGEWYGSGIQRSYGLDHKRFALFNVGRWTNVKDRPSCCDVARVIVQSAVFDTMDARYAMNLLREHGSMMNDGYYNPEGIVIYHAQSNQSFKWTFEHDEAGKEHGA
jgi:hypothetical protein